MLIEDTEVLRVLWGLNPWWLPGRVPSDLARPVRRQAYYQVRKWLSLPRFHRAIMLSGARRVGKTTILYQLAQEALTEGNLAARQVFYLSFDHPILKLTPMDRILRIYQNNLRPDREEALLLIDEIHFCPDWMLWLKMLVDRYPGYRIVATGSASSVLASEGAETGVGRWVQVTVPTLTFYEYLELLDIYRPEILVVSDPIELGHLAESQRQEVLNTCLPLEASFHRYLLTGGFPELALLEDFSLGQRLLREDVVDKVLKRDMTALYGVRNVLEMERLFIYLCLHTGQILNQEVLARELGISRTTVGNDLKYLEMANLIYRSDPVPLGGKRVLKARPKVYLADASIRNAVLLKGEEILTDAAEMGLVVETAVYKHLLAYYTELQPRLGYWREPRSGREVDVVVALPNGQTTAVEVKYRETPRVGERDGLVELVAQGKVQGGLLVTKNPGDYGPARVGGGQILRLPAFFLLYLLGHAQRQHSLL